MGDDLAIVEVKSARTHDIAAGYFGRAQQIRLGACAEEYLFDTHLAGRDPMTTVDMRFDLALVDGRGMIEIIENAFGANAIFFTGMFVGMSSGAALGGLAMAQWGWNGVVAMATATSLAALLVRMYRH